MSKNIKKLNIVEAILNFGGHLGFIIGIFNPVFYTWFRSFVRILVILTNRGDKLKEKQGDRDDAQEITSF